MTLELKPQRYVSAQWAVFGREKDYLAHLWRDREGGDDRWHVQYRFRYYADDKAHNSEDQKNWYEWSINAPWDAEERIRSLVADMAAKLSSLSPTEWGGPVEVLDIRSDDPDTIMKKLAAVRDIHVRFESMMKGGEA